MAKAGGSGGTGTDAPERKGLLERWVEGRGVVGVGADEAVEEEDRLELRDDLQKPMAYFLVSFLAFYPLRPVCIPESRRLLFS
jgi:hypothetical protein